MSNFWKNFFINRTVRQTFAFPMSCFHNIFDSEAFYVQCILREKLRIFVFQGEDYEKFLDSSNFQIFLEKYKNLPYYANRDWSKFISFTNIYENQKLIKKVINKQVSYSAVMYNQWSSFINELKTKATQYKYMYYIDVENFYKNIYPHFIAGLSSLNNRSFVKSKDRSSDAYKCCIENYGWNDKFQNLFVKKVCKFQETCGIPIGNGLSDFVSEQILMLIEYFVLQDSNKGFISIRYRDDIYLFSNDESQIKDLYSLYKKHLLDFELSINDDKSKLCSEDKSDFINIKSYAKENELVIQLRKNRLNSDSLVQFVEKFPKSSKINTLLKAICKSDMIDDDLLSNLITIVKKSKTNVIPWVIAIIDKKLSPQDYSTFANSFSIHPFCSNDKVWLWCYEKKNNISSNLSIYLNDFISDYSFAKTFSTDSIDFEKDADVFHY